LRPNVLGVYERTSNLRRVVVIQRKDSCDEADEAEGAFRSDILSCEEQSQNNRNCFCHSNIHFLNVLITLLAHNKHWF